MANLGLMKPKIVSGMLPNTSSYKCSKLNKRLTSGACAIVLAGLQFHGHYGVRAGQSSVSVSHTPLHEVHFQLRAFAAKEEVGHYGLRQPGRRVLQQKRVHVHTHQLSKLRQGVAQARQELALGAAKVHHFPHFIGPFWPRQFLDDGLIALQVQRGAEVAALFFIVLYLALVLVVQEKSDGRSSHLKWLLAADQSFGRWQILALLGLLDKGGHDRRDDGVLVLRPG